MTKLQPALQGIGVDLSRFARSSGFWGVFADVFGSGYGKSAAHAIYAQLSRGDLSQLARVEVVSAAVLGPARAAYASTNGTIYLSDRFLVEASQAQLQAALLEEIGHAIDARVNASDRPGDEGELFSLLVRGITPTASERQRMQAGDDRRTIAINGVALQVEQAAPVVYETSKVGVTGSFESLSYSYKISGTNAIWVEQKRANRTLRFFNGTSSSSVANSVYSDFGAIAISGATIAYTKSDGQDLEVYRSRAGVTTRLTTNTNHDGNLLIDGNNIVWQTYDAMGTGDIYRNNGTTTTRITNNTVDEYDLRLSGNQLIWAGSDGDDYEIFINDGNTTRALTNNTFDDYSPVLSGNRAAWFGWNNNQENLFFYDGSTTRQITSNLDIFDPIIAGSNLVYKQVDSAGKTSLKLYNPSTGTSSQLSATLESFSQVATSGNLVAWLEPGTSSASSDQPLATLKLFNGSTTTTVANNVVARAQSGSFGYDSTGKFALQGSKIYYLAKSDVAGDHRGDLYLYDSASSNPVGTQLTAGEMEDAIADLGVTGDQILWTDGLNLKLTQPSTKPILSFSSSSVSLVEGFTSPQSAALTVNLSAASGVPVTVLYETYEDGSQSASSYLGDYGATASVLTFAAGVTSQTINVPIFNDFYPESDEVFRVRLFDPSNAVLVPGQNTASVTISDTWQVTGANGNTFTLPAGVENLTLAGSNNINGVGNADNNEIRGNRGNNRLSGGGGADILIGGLGNDTYVHDMFTRITENPGEGIDTVEWSPSYPDRYTLDSNLENLTLLGLTNSSVSGNLLNNRVTGNSGHNFITGGPGSDRLTGLGGADNFCYFRDSGFGERIPALTDSLLSAGIDVITDFNANEGDSLIIGQPVDFFFNAGQVRTWRTNGDITADLISAKLTTSNFLPNFAATITTLSSNFTKRTFVVINDALAGYSANNDAVIEITGWKGAIGIGSFV
ncbi:MAG: bluetail domain-containing putative surface protein [Cyanobacteriota bacterium]|nr:bluetail domain-containing putative surface protein [Cyanobacteriota bacterium]